MQPTSGGLFAVATITLAGMLASPALAQDAASSGCATGGIGHDPSAPCFANVDDILGGQTHLLRNDDLVLTRVVRSGSETSYHNTPLFTEDLRPVRKPDIPQQQVDSTDCKVESDDGTLPAFMRLGRLYELPYDVIVNSVWTRPGAGDDCSQTFFVIDTDGTVLARIGTSTAGAARLALFDADLDGYDDIFIMDADNIQLHSPSQVGDTSSEMVFRAVYDFPSDQEFRPRADPVSGDFNGDGAVDVAWLGAAFEGEIRAYFVSICPVPKNGKSAVVLGQQCTPFKVIPWPMTATIGTGVDWKEEPSTGNPWFPGLGLAAGDHDGKTPAGANVPDDEIVIVVRRSDDTSDITAYAYDLDVDDLANGELTWKRTAETTLPDSSDFFGAKLSVVGGPLRFAEIKEQVVVGASELNSYGIWVLHFADDLTMEVGYHFVPSNQDRNNADLLGIAIGRFDPMVRDGEIDFNQQIAAHFSEQDCPGVVPCTPIEVIDIFDFASHTSFTPVHINDLRTVLTFDPTGSFADLSAPLQAGDLQGRSMRLGAPEKATVVHTQVDVVLGMPPMHVDFVDPSVVNVSVAPDDFNLAYTDATVKSVAASRQSTTSYTYTKKESADAKISYGIPDVDSVSVTAKEAAAETHKQKVASKYDTYQKNTYTLTTATVFDDKVLATQQRMNIYTYPVIGGVCPAGAATCAPDKRLPLAVQFSGPDNVTHHPPTAAKGLEWYQPVHEPGNLFSYPASLDQLIANQPRLQGPDGTDGKSRFEQLNAGDTYPWQIAGSDSTQSVNWTTTGTETKTAESTSNHSFDASASVSGSAEVFGVGISASATFDYSSSRSVSTLNSLTNSLSESNGVTLVTDLGISSLDKPLHNYSFGSYIFGLEPPTGTIQTDADTPSDGQVTGHGPLNVASIADPLASGSDVWWIDTYKDAPDVGLHHPVRWSQSVALGSNAQQASFNCPINYTSSGTSPECSPGPIDLVPPVAVAERPFYQIKGVFVHPGPLLDLGAPGPTTTSATFGDQLLLRARVYNYSFAQMPDRSEVHVAFYAQRWLTGQFESEPGDQSSFVPAVFIGEAVVERISPFCGGLEGGGQDTCAATDPPAPRNWEFAEVELDTTNLGAPPAGGLSYWKFWVVTWIELDGNLMPEIAGHGLQADTDLGSLSHLDSLADVPIETYSNNLGFYHQAFTLMPAQPAATPGALAAAAEPEPVLEPALRIERIEVPRGRRLRGAAVPVRATLTSNVLLRDITVQFFAGDPDRDGVLFDVDTIAYIAPDEPFVVPVLYQPSDCHAERIHVAAFSTSDAVEPARAKTRRRIRPDRGCREAKHHRDRKHYAERDHRDR